MYISIYIALTTELVPLLICFVLTGLSLEPKLPGGRCKCFKQTNSFIKPSKLTRVEFFPPGRSCPQLECLSKAVVFTKALSN
uniref:Chemokine interleukin-8-like domain-containing protein n=1 Tax=Xenopus tropicalis TaxID=8364 RepID=A0A6I8SIF9_XENTR